METKNQIVKQDSVKTTAEEKQKTRQIVERIIQLIKNKHLS
jgi:ribosomal protein L17